MAQLTIENRQQIEYHHNQGYGPTAIGKMIGKDKSVISREINRNKVNGEYVSSKAHQKACYRRYWVLNEPQKIRTNPQVEGYIEEKLKQLNPWSPEQIAGRWNEHESQAEGFKISAPTIYKYLYRFRLDLCQYLCTKRQKKKKRKPKSKREMILNRIPIEQRPPLVENRTRIGDWEGDTIQSIKGDKTRFLVLHDRASRYLKVSKSKDSTKKRIISKVRKLLKNNPKHTMTLDNGIEFKGHQSFGLDTYFCNPYASWEKGAVENSNRLIRKAFPKKTKLKYVSPQKLAQFVNALNHTPRKSLNFKTPHEVFFSIS